MKVGSLVKLSNQDLSNSKALWVGVIVRKKQGYCDVVFFNGLGLTTNIDDICLEVLSESR